MNQFNNLPPEIIEFIFKHVNLDDLINLRIVDKRFKEICDQFKIKQLNVTNRYNDHNFWFYTNDPMYSNKENQIKTSKFLNYKSIFKLDKCLRRLSLSSNGGFNISILNEFKLLEHLEMNIFLLDDNYKLNLENLKIVSIRIGIPSINRFNLKKNKLTFDTNKLFAFESSYNKLDQFIFNYPDKILFYETDYNDYDNYDEIKEFINLEYLKINRVCDSIGRVILSTFKNLKTIDLNMNKLINQNKYDNLKEDIISILNDKENLKRSEFQIYFYGVKLINQNQINQFKWSFDYNEFNYNVLEFQIKNYDLLKDDCSMNQINYCDLIKLIKIIPSSFSDKFPYIYRVYANDHIDNEDQFIKFLNQLPYLFKLELINCGLNQSFYDKLINLVYLNNLEYLIIKDKEDLGLNFDFIINLKRLYSFETNPTIDNHIDLIGKLFKENQNIHQFIFKFDTKNYIKIYKYDCFNFEIYSYYYDDNSKEIKNFSIEDLNLDEIILKLKDLKF